MALTADLIGVAFTWGQAGLLGDSIGTVAGAGTTQGAGTTLFGDVAAYSMIRGTTTGGATAFTLSANMILAKPYTFTNTSSTTALLYPFTGGAINGGSTDASISVPQNVTVVLIRETATAVVAIVSGNAAGSFASLAVSGNATVGGTLGVTGAATFSSTVATGALTVTGAIGATGAETILNATATPAGGTAGAGYKMGTAGIGVFFGSGAPSLSAPQGSLYLRTDGTTTNDRAYINTNGTTGWAALTTAS